MMETIECCFGHILRSLENRRDVEKTIVAHASDRAAMLRGRGLWAKRTSREACVRVPFVIRDPAGSKSRRDVPACLQDLTATIIDVTGPEPLSGVDGRTLRWLLERPGGWHGTAAFLALGPWAMATDGTVNLIATMDAGSAYYALQRN